MGRIYCLRLAASLVLSPIPSSLSIQKYLGHQGLCMFLSLLLQPCSYAMKKFSRARWNRRDNMEQGWVISGWPNPYWCSSWLQVHKEAQLSRAQSTGMLRWPRNFWTKLRVYSYKPGLQTLSLHWRWYSATMAVDDLVLALQSCIAQLWSTDCQGGTHMPHSYQASLSRERANSFEAPPPGSALGPWPPISEAPLGICWLIPQHPCLEQLCALLIHTNRALLLPLLSCMANFVSHFAFASVVLKVLQVLSYVCAATVCNEKNK